jgi:hypothetical protein
MHLHEKTWSAWHKISFRFFFLFFGVTSTFCWVMTTYFAYAAVAKANLEDQYNLYKPLNGFFHWLDIHIYHTGYDPKLHVSLPVDNHFGVVYYVTIFFLTVIAAIAWSILDRKRINYDKLFYWFNIYLRYTLAIVILGYGIDKVIPVQMPHPRTVDMIRLFGNQSKEDLLWKFMGVSPGYMMFTGSCEIIAAILLFSRRTAVFGYLFILGVLTNVLALNWFYNISVKFFSSLLWLYALYLLVPWLSNIVQFFFSGVPATIPQKHFKFEKQWKRYSLSATLLLVPLAVFVLQSIGDIKTYRKEVLGARKEKMYNVTAFNTKDTLPADTFRWKRVLFVYDNYIVIYNMKDKQDWYQYDTDSLKKNLTLHGLNKSPAKTLQYNYPSAGQLQLSGKWKGKDINVSLKLSPVDSMYLNKEKIKIMQD